MKVTFYEPQGGELTNATLRNVLLLVGHTVPAETISKWTELERLLAYDYAMREHLNASDNIVRMRPCPSFVTAADVPP